MRALDLFAIYRMDFEDCLSVAHMERQQLKEIYSYVVWWVVGLLFGE